MFNGQTNLKVYDKLGNISYSNEIKLTKKKRMIMTKILRKDSNIKVIQIKKIRKNFGMDCFCKMEQDLLMGLVLIPYGPK